MFQVQNIKSNKHLLLSLLLLSRPTLQYYFNIIFIFISTQLY